MNMPNVEKVPGDLWEQGGVVCLTGAGMSTDSGIPDYRGPSGASSRKHAPMTYQTFVGDPIARRNYWARGYVGWRSLWSAEPNAGHRTLAGLEERGAVIGVITQNVDGLHQKAGSSNVIDLHGRLDRVICLACGHLFTRAEVHERIHSANPDWHASAEIINPDGDAVIAEEYLETFVLVDCERCGGMLKPDVVYFGERVPQDRVDDSYALVDQAKSLLVLGSSLHVYSGRRFVLRAHERGIPIVIVNQGETKCDELATTRIHGSISKALTND